MSLTKETIEDKIEVVGQYKSVQVRTATVVKEDGVELNRSFSRKVILAGDDYSGESTEVQGICSTVHTSEVVAAYAAYVASQSEED
ncbi:hypothetical protein N9095_00575 [bacterium]|nr:hypothetical protein [bacterium]